MEGAERDATKGPGSVTHALRVTFAYRGHEIAVVRTQRIAMIVPRPPTPPPREGQSGYWVEARADTGALLFYCPLHSPVRVDAEVYPAFEGQAITRVPLPDPAGEFDVLVPDAPAAAALTLYGPPADVARQAQPASVLVAVPFATLRRLAEAAPAPPGRDGAAR